MTLAHLLQTHILIYVYILYIHIHYICMCTSLYILDKYKGVQFE